MITTQSIYCVKGHWYVMGGGGSSVLFLVLVGVSGTVGWERGKEKYLWGGGPFQLPFNPHNLLIVNIHKCVTITFPEC